jgi:SSS family solute:Na+ symporter
VAWTDALQAIVMLLASLAAVYFMAERGFNGFSNLFARMNQDLPELLAGSGLFKFHVFLGITLPWLFFSVSNPQVTQRLFIPKSVKAFKQMIGGFLIFGLIFTLVSVLWGFGARLLVPGLENPDNATPALLALAVIPRTIAVVLMIGILAAAISTIDSILLTLSSMCARDIYRTGINPKASEDIELKIGKTVIPILAVIFFIFAYWAAGKSGLAFMIAPLSSAASAGLLMAVPSIIGAFFWRKATAAGAFTSMLIGAAAVLVLQLTGYKPLGMWPGVWGLLICVLFFILVSLCTRPPEEKAKEFLDYLQETLPKGNFF